MADSKSTADVISDVVDKVGDGLAQIGAAIQSHAPEAWALVVKGNYAIAMAGTVIGAVLLVLSALLLIPAIKLLRFGMKRYDARANPRGDEGVPFIFFGVVGCGACVVLLIIGLVNALDSHNIAMLLAPEGTTARDILLRALGR